MVGVVMEKNIKGEIILNNMKKITEGKVIILGDLHQKVAYANAVLRKEDWFDHVVCLGDELDTFLQVNQK